MQRLLAEEGLFAWFEHVGAGDGPDGAVGGRHVLVIADANDAFGSAASGHSGAALGPIRYHRAAAMEQSDYYPDFSDGQLHAQRESGRFVSNQKLRARAVVAPQTSRFPEGMA